MRRVTVAASWLASWLAAWPLLGAAAAHADDTRLQWPLRPPAVVLRGFDAPTPNWRPGHRGVDLAGVPGEPIFAAGDATVVYAGTLADWPVVSLGPSRRLAHQLPAGAPDGASRPARDGGISGRHPGGWAPGLPSQGVPALGRDVGPASDAHYVDPLGLLKSTPIRLKPVTG
ncbi:hypothetical protein I551_3269 [Mycobacterium ulcerans str. Harvey]|uniref:Peptidase M23 family protein n=1 Tax=Mycobacterium ulcerans str. Harvey TaxID=1299332 RepID=A0ABN0R043_MYCUL|nr:hypothetical protein I551_3269 [Mycobacterium ulcerans str. Harvey]